MINILVKTVLNSQNKSNEQKLNQLDLLFSGYVRKLNRLDSTDEWSNPNGHSLSIWYYQRGSSLNKPSDIEVIKLSDFI